jgi:aryl-alcohol dehydrogenase-like predicted oxidoreductase
MVANGVNLIDTAPCYGNGTAEKVVGTAIKGMKREDILISTKFGLVPSIYNKGYARDTSYSSVMREVESSLMNLKTDYIDFYFVHWPCATVPIKETMSALAMLKKEGIIRYVGVSNFSQEQILECEKYLQVDVQQPPYSMADKRFEDLMKWGYEKGISSMTYGSMGSGILSGAYRTTPDFDKKDFRLTFYDYFKEPKFSKIQELLKVMDQIAADHNVPVAQVALNWTAQQEFVGTALVGVRSKAHAEENCKAFDWMLSAEEMKRLDDEMTRLGL